MTAQVPMRRIMAYHPHLHIILKGEPHVFCADLPDYMSDEALTLKLARVLGHHDMLLDSPEVAKQALANHGITGIHVHRVADEVVS